ncbi:MAG: hypothetical protein ACRD18_08805 [Terriglobia bacterium]
MSRKYIAIAWIVLTIMVGLGARAAPVKVSSGGWIVTAAPEAGVLSISRGDVGTILKEVRLNLRGEHGLQQLKGWSVETQGENNSPFVHQNPELPGSSS